MNGLHACRILDFSFSQRHFSSSWNLDFSQWLVSFSQILAFFSWLSLVAALAINYFHFLLLLQFGRNWVGLVPLTREHVYLAHGPTYFSFFHITCTKKKINNKEKTVLLKVIGMIVDQLRSSHFFVIVGFYYLKISQAVGFISSSRYVYPCQLLLCCCYC